MNLDSADVNLGRCFSCSLHERTSVFDLCKHAASHYSAGGKSDFHTVGHMRTVGGCGNDARLFSPIDVKKNLTAPNCVRR